MLPVMSAVMNPLVCKGKDMMGHYYNEAFLRVLFTCLFMFCVSLSEAETVDVDGVRYDLNVVTKKAEVIKGLKTEWEFISISETIEHNKDVYQVTSIGKDAFANCFYMMGITLPSTITSIGENAFAHCGSLTDIELPLGLVSIADNAFLDCTNLTNVTIPHAVTSIGDFAFMNCHQLQRVIMSDAVSTLGEGVFARCKSLKSVNLSENITSIPNQAFSGCERLENVVIPASVEMIGHEAFAGCQSVLQIVVRRTIPPIIYSDSFPYYTIPLYVPRGCADTYMDAENWNCFSAINDKSMFLEIPESEMMTFCATEDLDFSAVGSIEAYIGSGFNKQTGRLLVTRVYDVPAGTGLLLKGYPGVYAVPYSTSYSIYANLLEGTVTATPLSQCLNGYTHYILASGSHGICFYIVSGTGEIAAGKAYLKIPSSESAGRMRIGIDNSDNTTGIGSLVTSSDKCGMFTDMQGRSVIEKPRKKGVYINKGKKVIVR